ncbi:hypothetical protein MGN70_014007 [Eutypa lata]|nr:hypothetical protein MGN70_014007 [Eutypa lata]
MAQKTIAFFGASGGVGLAALKHSLAAGHQCIALCRNPSKLTAVLAPETTSNLKVVQGNVRDVEAVSQCLTTPGGRLVDDVIFTVGSRFVMSKMNLEDLHVCEHGMGALLQAIADIRRKQQQQQQQEEEGVGNTLHILAFSTTGMSRFGRDVPLSMVPFYHVALKVPHADKRIMEDKLVESGEAFTVVRASLLFDGNSETDTPVRVGIEDPKSGVIESKAIGYRISREDAGKWIARNFVLGAKEAKYVNKTITVTY